MQPVCCYRSHKDSVWEDRSLLPHRLFRSQRKHYRFFKIDYDRQSARVTNGELLRRLLAARRVRGQRNRTAGQIQVHNWPIISPGERASQAPPVFGLCCSQRPRVGGNLALGCSSVRAFWVTALTRSFIKAWERAALWGPLWTDCGASWKSGSALAKTGRQWTIRACPESIHISRLGLMCL